MITGIILIPFALLVGGRIPYFLFYVYLLAHLIPIGHSLLGRLFITGDIKIPEKDLMTGEEITIKYGIENNSIFSLPRLEVENSIANKLTGKREQTKLLTLKSKEHLWMETTIICSRRGIYQIGDFKITIKDIFNLFSFQKIISNPIALKVYPQITPLRNIAIDKSQDYFALSELREYQEGDPIKKIHWKASAKRDVLMVKNYEEWGEEEVTILLDSNVNSYSEDVNSLLEDKAVETTLSIINHFLENNANVTLYFQRYNTTIQLKGNHYGYLKLFMEELVDFSPSGVAPFYQQVEEVRNNLKVGSMLFLITPLLDKKIGAQGIRLKKKNQLRCVILGDSQQNPMVWQANKEIGKILEEEGVKNYFIDQHQDIRNVMEEGYLHGA